MADFLRWVKGKELDIRHYRYEVAVFIAETLEKHGLLSYQEEYAKAGIVRPETLLFTCFGAPGNVTLASSDKTTNLSMG